MNKEETKKILLDMFNTIEGTFEEDKNTGAIMGHPNFYLLHSKEELLTRVENFVNTKETFNRYDIYYFVKQILKDYLTIYDTHTNIFLKTDLLPIDFKIINNKVYIMDITPEYNKLRYKECVAINGINIKNIISDIEKITVYPSVEYLNTIIEFFLNKTSYLLALPCIKDDEEKLVFTTETGDSITFKIDSKTSYQQLPIEDDNYNIKKVDNIVLCRYSSCKDNEKMIEMIKKLSELEKQNNDLKYIIDIRSNEGGDSRVIKPLISFLENKESVTLIDEKVYSSGIMAAIDLKNINSYIIGTNLSTTINHFGNNLIRKKYNNLGLKVTSSTKLFMYNDEYKCHSFNKLTINEYFKTLNDIKKYDHELFSPDEYVTFKIEDYQNNYDPQLARAIEYLKEKNLKR